MTQSETASFAEITASAEEMSETLAAASSARETQHSFAQTPILTAALREGNELAYRWLHSEWNGRLSRYCFALAAGDAAVAQEIAQATWIRIVRHIRVLPDEVALWNWIACAARSAMRDLRRTGGRYRRALARLAEWLGRKDARPAEHAEAYLLAALEKALERLDGDERLLIAARYFEPVSLEQIGRDRGLSARAIEGRLARLRDRLRRMIHAELRGKENDQ